MQQEASQRASISITPRTKKRFYEPTVVVREDSRTPEVPVPEEMPPSKYRLQQLGERFLGALADKEKRMSFRYILTDTWDRKPLIARQSSFLPLKQLTELRRVGTWPETWSKRFAPRQVRPKIFFSVTYHLNG